MRDAFHPSLAQRSCGALGHTIMISGLRPVLHLGHLLHTFPRAQEVFPPQRHDSVLATGGQDGPSGIPRDPPDGTVPHRLYGLRGSVPVL